MLASARETFRDDGRRQFVCRSPLFVGRDALIPPNPHSDAAPPVWYAPLACRGRFHIGPARHAANARGRDESRPYA